MDITDSSGCRDFMWAVKLQRLAFEIVGLWPKSNKYTKKTLWSEIWVGIIFILLIFVSNVPMMYAIIQVWGNVVLVIDNLHTALPQIIASVKYIIIRRKRKILTSIVNMMAEDWMAFKLDRERDVMIKRAHTARLIMIIGYIIVIIASFTAIIPPFFGIHVAYTTNSTKRRKSLPLVTYDFYDTDKSPQYELTLLIQVLTTFLISNIYMSIDGFLIVIILHVCGQLENFRYRLSKLISCNNFNKVLNDIVATHLRLIRFAGNIENTYSLLMLVLILYFGVVFCLSGFLFTIIITDKKVDKAVITQGCFTILIFIILLMNTFLFCGAGELVTKQSNEIYRTLCDLEWYKLEPRNARSLILLMVQAKYPLCITAGKIFPLTMATFCNILKSSMGYISLLLAKYS